MFPFALRSSSPASSETADPAERRAGSTTSEFLPRTARRRRDGSRNSRAHRAICRAARVGGGEILLVEAAALFDLVASELHRDPWFTAQGPAADPRAMEAASVGAHHPPVQLPERASMGEMIETLWRLPRDIVSDGLRRALTALATQVPMTIHEYPTGTECWTWIVPEKWTCHEAYLETLDGRRLFSYADHPLHVVSVFAALRGRGVAAQELLAHLHVHQQRARRGPVHLQVLRARLGTLLQPQPARRLDRRSLPRRDPHQLQLRHAARSARSSSRAGPRSASCSAPTSAIPRMANDDLSGVVVGIEVMRRAARSARDLRYTYRLLIVPETIGSVAWLSQHEDLIPRSREACSWRCSA